MTITADLHFKPYYDEKLYFKANVETGVLSNRSGRRMIALTNDFLIGLHRAIASEVGDRTENVLRHCGKRWGTSFGKGLDAEWTLFYEQPALEFPIAFFVSLLIQEFAHNGWGILQVELSHYREGILEVELDGAIMSEINRDEVNYPVDVLTAGILAGIFSHFMSEDLDCVQTEFPINGEGSSKFILAVTKRIDLLGPMPKNEISHASVLGRLTQIRI